MTHRLKTRKMAEESIRRLNGRTFPGSVQPLQVRFADSQGQKQVKHLSRSIPIASEASCFPSPPPSVSSSISSVSWQSQPYWQAPPEIITPPPSVECTFITGNETHGTCEVAKEDIEAKPKRRHSDMFGTVVLYRASVKTTRANSIPCLNIEKSTFA
jgi:hypothetical protein